MKTPLLLLCVIVFFSVATAAERPANPPLIKVTFSETVIEIENAGSPGWRQAVVYINGDPPEGFKAEVIAPLPGKKVQIKLVTFSDKKGNRFTPSTMALKKIWVGGGGFDFKRYNVTP